MAGLQRCLIKCFSQQTMTNALGRRIPQCPSWYLGERYLHKSSALYNKNTEKREKEAQCIEKCSKKQRLVLTDLSYPHNEYLQPRTPPTRLGRFSLSKPKIAPILDKKLEEGCRAREHCRQLAMGKGSKKK